MKMDHSLISKVVYVLFAITLLSAETQCANVFVSSKATKDKDCGESEDDPCRTIKAAVKIAKDDYNQITIMASDEKYQDCPIYVNRPLTFKGIYGRPIIDCKGEENAFVFNFDPKDKKIQKQSVIKIDVANLKVQNVKTGFTFLKKNTNVNLHLENVTFANNDVDVSWSRAPLCQVYLTNVLAYGSSGNGIEIDRCEKAVVSLKNTTFYGKYFKVVTSKESFELNIDFKGVTFDMRNRYRKLVSTDSQNTDETHSPMHIMTAAKQTTLTIQKTEFLHHFGDRNAMINITSFQRKPTKKEPLQININFQEVNFMNNTVQNGNGGAIWFNLTNIPAPKYKRKVVKFKDCTFIKNSALNGGAVWFSKWDKKTVLLYDCSFKDNRAFGDDSGSGGGLFALGGRLVVQNSKFEANTATKYGGALYLANKKALSIKITNSVFRNQQRSWRSVEGDIMYVDNAQTTFYGDVLFDLSSYNLGESMFLFEGRPSVLRMSNKSRFICPPGYNHEESKSTYKTTPTRPHYFPAYHIFSFSCKPCQDLFYSTTRGSWQVNGTKVRAKCYKCPYGASCNGTIRARANFWGLISGDKVEMIPCPKGYCCKHEPCESHDSCDSHRTGTLCSHCSDGFTESMGSTDCHPNDKCDKAAWLWPVFNVFFIFFILCFHQQIVKKLRKWLLWDDNSGDEAPEYRENERNHNRMDTERTESNNTLESGSSITELSIQVRHRTNYPGIEQSSEYNNSGGYIKAFYYFYQAVLLMRLSSYETPSPLANWIINFLTPVLNFQFTNVWSCGGEDLRPVRKVFLKNSVAYCVWGLCLIAYILYRFARWCKGVTTDDEPGFKASNFKVRLVGTVMHVILFSYVALTQLAVQLLNCVKVGDKNVLYIKGSDVCYRSYQKVMWLYFSVCIVPFPFALLVGRILLASGRIAWKTFILACFFPLIFLTWLGIKCSIHCRDPSAWRKNLTGDDPYKDQILYILQYSYKKRENPNASWVEHCCENWESVLMLRRLLLVLVFIFVQSPLTRAYLFFLLSILFLAAHVFVKPFVNEMVNNFDTISLMLIVLISGLGISEASYNNAGQLIPSSIKTLQTLQEYFLAFLPIVLLLGLLYPRAKHYIRRCRARSRSQPGPNDDREVIVSNPNIQNERVLNETSRLT